MFVPVCSSTPGHIHPPQVSLWNLCRSQARIKAEGSAEGLQPFRVRHLIATETTQEKFNHKLEDMLKISRLRWLGHIHRSDNERLSKQALEWTPTGWKIKRGRPRKTWRNTIIQDLDGGGMTWGEAEGNAEDRVGWRNCVARCAASAWND